MHLARLEAQALIERVHGGRAAFVLLRPQFWPTSRKVVLPLTDEVVLPPWRLNRSSASSRVKDSRLPVTTSVLWVMQSGWPVGMSCSFSARMMWTTAVTFRANHVPYGVNARLRHS